MSSRGRPKHPDILTPREWEVLGHVREGRSNEQIAERLGISIDGVKYHVSEILSKLALDNRHDAARWAEDQHRGPRPWAAGALTPLFFWRRFGTSWLLGWLSPVIAGGLLVAIAAGLGLLIWGLLATRGGEEAATAPGIPATTAVQILDRPSPNFGAVDFVSDEEGWMTAGGGLLHSTDGGATWEEIARVTGNDIDFFDSKRGWLVGRDGAIYRSEDGGRTWSEQDSGTDIHLTDIETIGAEEAWVVGSGQGNSDAISYPLPTVLLHTVDGGITWQAVETPAGAWFGEITFVGEKGWTIGSCSCSEGILGALLSTEDGGITWTLLDTDLPTLSYLTFTDDSNGWVLSQCFFSSISVPPCAEGPYVTNDGGRTWALMAQSGYRSYQALGFRDASTGWVVAVEDKNDCPCERVVLETADGGETWKEQATVHGNPGRVDELKVFGETIFVTGSGTALRSTNSAESFEVMRTPAVELGDLEFISPEVGFTATRSVFLKTEDGGVTWELVRQLDGFWSELDFLDAERGFASVDRILHRTVDGGKTWQRVFPKEDDDLDLDFVIEVKFSDDQHGWIFTKQAAYVTSDGGETWDERLLGDIREIKQVHVLDENQAWAVVDTGTTDPLRRLMRTSDAGRTWEIIREDRVEFGMDVFFDAVTLQAAWYLPPFVEARSGALFRTTDGGETWLPSDVGNGSWETLEFADEEHGWISGPGGKLLRTEDGGTTWQDVQLAEPVWGNLVILDAATGWLQPLSGSAFTLTTIDGRTLLYQLR